MVTFFLHAMYFTRLRDDTIELVVWNYIKTYRSDDIFWTVFDMPNNIFAKDSLRANGAFTMPSFKMSEFIFKIDSTMNLSDSSYDFMIKIDGEHNRFIDVVNNDVEKMNYYLLEQNGYLKEELIKMIANIELGNLGSAKCLAEREISKGNRGGFQSNSKDIYEYTLEYCTKQEIVSNS